jgi:hypothetical protein
MYANQPSTAAKPEIAAPGPDESGRGGGKPAGDSDRNADGGAGNRHPELFTGRRGVLFDLRDSAERKQCDATDRYTAEPRNARMGELVQDDAHEEEHSREE